MEKERGLILNQLARSLEEAEIKLEEAYKKEDYDRFNKLKKMITEIQARILEEIK